MRNWICTIAIGLLAAAPALAQKSAPAPAPQATEELAALFRTLLIANLPNPLAEKNFTWGQQREVPVGIKWKREGIFLKPEVQKKLHNDGTWRKIHATIDNPDKSIRLSVSDVKQHDEGRVTFTVNVTFPVHVEFEQQIWESGLRLYSGSTRARAQVGALLKCESTSKAVYVKGAFFPEIVFRMKVNEARIGYSDLEVIHTLGVGGDAAKLLGEAVIETIKQWKPSIETDLLAKANKAIEKAGDTKEVRLGFGKLFEKK